MPASSQSPSSSSSSSSSPSFLSSLPANAIPSSAPAPLKSVAASAAPAAPFPPSATTAAGPSFNWHHFAAMNPAVNPFLVALAAANQGVVPSNPASASMLPNAQPTSAQFAVAAGAGLAPYAPQVTGQMPQSSAAAPQPPPFFPPNLPYAGLAAMGYPTQSTLAASALLSGLPLPGALPAAQPPQVSPQVPQLPSAAAAAVAAAAATVPLSAGSATLPPAFNLATSPWLANLGLSASMLNSLGANPVSSNGMASNGTSSSSPIQSDGTPSSPVASVHNALATTSKRPPQSSSSAANSTVMVHSSSAAASTSDVGSPPPTDHSSTSLLAPKPLSAPSSALATVSAQVKAAAAASDTLLVKPGAQPNGTSQSSMTLTKNLSQFLLKLYNMVDDPTTDDLIHWSDAGTSFVVEHADELSKSVLPRFFKHSNFSSFVRQLNMYSFRKVTHITQGSLTGNSDDHRWEFSNDHFIRGLPDQLCFITRKKASAAHAHDADTAAAAGTVAGTSSAASASGAPTGDISNVLVEVSNVRKHQLTLSSEQKELQAHVQLLWRDMLSTKDQVARQQVTIDKILRFLASLYSAKDTKGAAAAGANNKLATDPEAGGGAAGSGREPEQSGIRKRKLQLLEYNPSSSSLVSGGGSRQGSPTGSPTMMQLDGFPDGVGVANIEQLPDSPTASAMRVPGMRLEELHDDEDGSGQAVGEADDGMDLDGVRGTATTSASTTSAKGKAKANTSAAISSSTRRASKSSSSSSTSGTRRSGSKSSNASKALEAVAANGTTETVLSPPPAKAARKSNRTAGTTSKAGGGRSSRASASATASPTGADAATNGHTGAPSLAAQPELNPTTHASPIVSLLPVDLSMPQASSTSASAPSPPASTAAGPTPEERLLWLTSETSRLGSNVQSLNPAIDDLTSTAAAELSGATDLDLDVLLGSLPDLSPSSSVPVSTLGAAAPAAPSPSGMPPLSPDAIMSLLHHPNAMAMFAAVQGAVPAGPQPDWAQLSAGADIGQGKMMSPASMGAATATSPNLGDLSAFLSFESDNDGDAATGE